MKITTLSALCAAITLSSLTGCASTTTDEQTKEYKGELTFYPDSVIPVFTKMPAPVDPACITKVGSCTFSNCAPPAGDTTVYSAGDITIAGGSLEAPVSLSFATGAYTGYPYGSFPKGGYASGDMLSITATGADVAAFSGTTAHAPGTVALVTPTMTRAASGDATQGRMGGYTFDTSRDLAIAWTGGTAGSEVVVVVSNLDDAAHPASLVCTVDATSGVTSVPASLLGGLGSPSSGFFSVYSRAKTTLETDDAAIEVSINGSMTAGTWTRP